MAIVKTLIVQTQPAGSGVQAAPTEPNHIIRKADLDAALSALGSVSHAAVTVSNSDTLAFTLTGQALTGSVRRKTTGLAAGEGLLGSGSNGLFVSLGTGANDAAAGNHGHGAATTSAPGFMSAADKARLDGLSSAENWLPSVEARVNLPLAGDRLWAYRVVRAERRIYEHVQTTGSLSEQWLPLPTTQKRVFTIGNGSDDTFDIDHDLATPDVIVGVRETSGTRNAVAVNWEQIDDNTVRLKFGFAIEPESMRVTVVG